MLWLNRLAVDVSVSLVFWSFHFWQFVFVVVVEWCVAELKLNSAMIQDLLLLMDLVCAGVFVCWSRSTSEEIICTVCVWCMLAQSSSHFMLDTLISLHPTRWIVSEASLHSDDCDSELFDSCWHKSIINAHMFVPLQADDTYMQLKKDLEYLDLKVRSGDQSSSPDPC